MWPHRVLDTSMSVEGIVHRHISIAIMHVRAAHGRRGWVGTDSSGCCCCRARRGTAVIVVILVASWCRGRRLLLVLSRVVGRHLRVWN